MNWFLHLFRDEDSLAEDDIMDDSIFGRVLENAGVSFDEYQSQATKPRRAADRQSNQPAR